jgi:hypothetical protein
VVDTGSLEVVVVVGGSGWVVLWILKQGSEQL